MSRIFTFISPLGDALLFRQMQGTEGLGSLFHWTVKLVSPNNVIRPAALLGKGATIQMELERGATRYLNGQVVGFRKTAEERRYAEYEATLMPWLWYATRSADCKIFQNMTAVEIADQVLQKYGFPFKKKLAETYQPIGYYVQYNETDFQFLSRLFQQEGIYYFFEHQDGIHTLVLADYPGAHQPLPNHAAIRFVSADNKGMAGEESIVEWEDGGSIKSGRYITDDYDFKKPSAELQQIRNDPKNPAHGDHEIYNWGQGYTASGHGAHLTKVELESLQTRHAFSEGATTVRGMAPGYTFGMFQHPDASLNQDYLVVSAVYHFQENPYATGDAGDHTDWHIRITAQKSANQYRQTKVAAWPYVGGPHTAVVVGPAGKEIWCDEYGRVKVQFPWDRYGKFDENSSCWIRVSSPWAGSNYGGIHVPRIGQEVLVEYLNGEVNRPIITGRVYNAEQMPPWPLPANATQSGYLTRSTPGGGYDNANAIRFEDQKGAEQLWLHAEKDQLTEVEHDEDKWVGNDRRKTIDRDETSRIRRDRTETVDRHETITVHGKRTEIVDGNEDITIHSNRTEQVDQNEKVSIDVNQKLTVGNNRTKQVRGSETNTVNRNQTTTIGMNKTETVKLTATETVGIAKIETIGAGYMLNVGAGWMSTVGFMHQHNVGISYKIQVGKTMDTSVGKKMQINVGGEDGSAILMDGDSITLKVGKSSLVLKKDGTATLSADKHVQLASERIDLN